MAKKKRTTLSANVSGDPIQAYLDAQQNLRKVDRQSSWDIIGDAVSDVTSGIAETNMAIQQEKAQKQI